MVDDGANLAGGVFREPELQAGIPCACCGPFTKMKHQAHCARSRPRPA